MGYTGDDLVDVTQPITDAFIKGVLFGPQLPMARLEDGKIVNIDARRK